MVQFCFRKKNLKMFVQNYSIDKKIVQSLKYFLEQILDKIFTYFHVLRYRSYYLFTGKNKKKQKKFSVNNF